MAIETLIIYGLTVATVIGSICWTRDRFNNLKDGLIAIEEGNIPEIVKNFGRIAISSHLSIDLLPEAIEKTLLKAHVPIENAHAVSDVLHKLESPIIDYIKKNG